MIGITSAGFYLGDTRTETYFRHLDHVAQLVGPRHVGIGLDNLDKPGLEFLWRFIDARPDEWPGIGPVCPPFWAYFGGQTGRRP